MEDTLLDILDKSVKYLSNKGVDNSRFIVEKIFCNILNINRIELYTEFERLLTDNEKKALREAIIKYDEIKEKKYEPNTVKEYYEKAKLYLDKKNIPESNILCNIIFSKLLNVDMAMLFSKYNNILEENDKIELKNILKKLVEKRIPIQYIFNEQNFYGYNFYVDKNVLIPRMDTESIVEKALELISNIENPIVLDIGTGSGAIAITVGLKNNESKILGVDISENALKVAKKNSEILKCKNVKFIYSDIFSNVLFKDFDLIVSNPPYISRDEIEYMGEDVILNEPESALFAENNGLYFYEKISSQAKEYMKNGGYILFEVGFKQGEKVKEIMEFYGFKDVEIGKDLTGNNRFVYGVKKEVNDESK